MSEIMSLVYLKETGSVLTYVTRRAIPSDIEQIGTLEKEQQEALKGKELEAIVGTELVVRQEWNPTDGDFKTVELRIPPDQLRSQLDILFTKFDPQIVTDHPAYFINQSGEPTRVTGGSVSIQTLSKNKITLQVSTAPSERKVWIQIYEIDKANFQIVTEGTISANASTSDVSIAELSNGKYLVLAAVTGSRPVIGKFQVP